MWIRLIQFHFGAGTHSPEPILVNSDRVERVAPVMLEDGGRKGVIVFLASGEKIYSTMTMDEWTRVIHNA